MPEDASAPRANAATRRSPWGRLARVIGVGLLFLALLVTPGLQAASSDISAHERIRVQLVSEHDAIRPGEPFRLALKLSPDEHWHTYWKNPGDSGLETRLEWQLPEGFTASAIDWPWPERLPVEHLVNYGYSGVHALPVTITPPRNLSPSQPHELTVKASWLVCRIACIPGDAELSLSLPATNTEPAPLEAQAPLFDWIDGRQPEAVDWPAQFSTEGDRFSLQVSVPEDFQADNLAMFPANNELVDHAAEARFHREGEQLLVSQALSDYFTEDPKSVEVVLVNTAENTAVSLTARPGQLATTAPPPSQGPGDGAPGTALALLLALGGGVLLNLMPCVFPVLSLKALNLVEGGDHQRAHALAFTAGVLVAFAAVAGALLGLRAAGEAIGWGFQLQSPGFVGLLALLLFAMGLSLSGLIDFGTRWMGAGQTLTQHSGLSGSFFTGVLACVVASPCTAPFMGTALGFAVTQSSPVAMAIFLALGLGLALPMLTLGFLPGLARALPRPGPWMNTFKQAMAFPLYLTVAWLLWVLTRQTGANALFAMLVGLVLLAFALWLTGRRTRSRWGTSLRYATIGLSLLAVGATLTWAARTTPSEETGPSADTAWTPWSAERLAGLRADGRAVFVNMTADWCVTCLVNERVALDTQTVREHMRQQNIVYLKGDWTRRDPTITDYLSRFGRNGVPLYVYYPEGPDAEPQVLPQILTPELVTETLQ